MYDRYNNLLDEFCFSCEHSIIKEHKLYCGKTLQFCNELIPSKECRKQGRT